MGGRTPRGQQITIGCVNLTVTYLLDIDECTLLNNNCEQICVDTIGSFYCSCRDGFVLGSDQSSCDKDYSDYDQCANNNINCSYGCVLENNAPVCFCPLGYELSTDSLTCSVLHRSVQFTMTTDYPYSSNLSDPSTDEFKHARVDITAGLVDSYSNIPAFLSLTIDRFSPGSTVIQYTAVFNQSLNASSILEIAMVTNDVRQITVLEKNYSVTGETFINYITILEPLTCTLCGENSTCVILPQEIYECRPPLSEIESRSLFMEVTLQKTFNSNYGNKLHLDYAAYEEDIEQAFAAVMTGVEDIQYLNVTDFSNHPEGVTTSLVLIFNTVANKTLQYDEVFNILLEIETIKRCVDIKDTCIALYGSISLGNTTTALDPVICSTCTLTQDCIQDNQTSRYQCVNKPITDQTAISTEEQTTRSTEEQTSRSTTEGTTTTVQSKSSSDLILGLGIGLPLAISALIVSTIMICMCCRRCRRNYRSDTDSTMPGQSEDDWNIRQAFGKNEPSLRGAGGAFGTDLMRQWSRTSGDKYHRGQPEELVHPYFGPGGLDDFTTGAGSSERLDFAPDTTVGEEDLDVPPRRSNFSWDFMFDMLNPKEEVRIPRPLVETEKADLFLDKKPSLSHRVNIELAVPTLTECAAECARPEVFLEKVTFLGIDVRKARLKASTFCVLEFSLVFSIIAGHIL
ncbi:Hypothetical predicted protein [Mytilus galloprovincialis]|uniref:EGF-like domain-containing protein n=1 Tax=Mytilus galloprovincialis TaxID=29158 RepID=A0A8B6DYD5_MYTGA|nr:Hypothetical predicted protein [Mytilus galloprovincialis]